MIVILVILASETAASVVCHDEQNYPAVHFHGLTEKQLPRIALVGRNINKKTDRASILEQTESGWIDAGEMECHDSWKCMTRNKQCDIAIPKINMPVKEAAKYRNIGNYTEIIEQTVSACSQTGDEVYFGIKFYEGEGSNGVGGIGRYNVKTKEMEIRRLLPLRNTSVTNLAFDGEDIWISASSYYECQGREPTIPLLRYNWDKNHIYNESDRDLRFCGFNVNDMYFHNDKLYIASDMGFSIGQRIQADYGDGLIYEWLPFRHYVPDSKSPEKMIWVTCEALYDEMLNQLPTKNDRGLIELLIKFKPEYVADKFLRLNQ